jgi:hypothetical protein
LIFLLLLTSTLLITLIVIACIFDNYRKYQALFYFSFIQLFYLLYTPWYNYFNDDYEAFNTKLTYGDFQMGLFILFLHLLFFYTGYFFLKFSQLSKKNVFFKKNIQFDFKNKVSIIYIVFFIVIAINAAFGDISLYDILLGKDDTETLGFKGGSNWIGSMANSLIILMLMSHFYKSNKLIRFILFPLTIFLFLILGFRYRLLLVIFGFVFMYLKQNILKTKKILIIVLTLFISFYFFMFFSENRISFYSNKYDNLKYNITDFNYESIHHNAVGSIVDFAMIKSLREGKTNYDFGQSMFVYPFIMIVPSSFFENSEKPYPAPQVKTIDIALDVPRSYGQACTFVGMSYFAYSVFGVLIFSFLFGCFASFLEFYKDNNLTFFFKVAFLLASFQLYTRGYLGLFLLPLAYMLLPLFFIKYKFVLYPKKHTQTK